jgi:hypothetical protein
MSLAVSLRHSLLQSLFVCIVVPATRMQLKEGDVTEIVLGEVTIGRAPLSKKFKLRTKAKERKADGYWPNQIDDLFELYFPHDPQNVPTHTVCTDTRMIVNAGGVREPPLKFTSSRPVPVSHWMDRTDRENLWMYLLPSGTNNSLWYVPNRTIQFNDFQDAMDYIGLPWVAPHDNNGVSKMELMPKLTERLRLEEFDTLMFANHLDGWTACGASCCADTPDKSKLQSWLVHEIVSLKAPKLGTMDRYTDTNTCPANPLLRRGPVIAEPYCTCKVYEAGEGVPATEHEARKERRFIMC